jgi:hypothetical protein
MANKLVVKLKAKDQKNGKTTEFEIQQANKLLSLNNSQWELEDKLFKWNGTEIAKV